MENTEGISFNSLLEYEDLEQIYLTYIKSINSRYDGLIFFFFFSGYTYIPLTIYTDPLGPFLIMAYVDVSDTGGVLR